MRLWTLTLVAVCLLSSSHQAGACSMTDFSQYTAALINPAVVSGPVDATGCDIGVYFNRGSGTVINANVFGAQRYGVVVNGNTNNVAVDVLNSMIHGILGVPPGFVGAGVYYRANLTGRASGKISGNKIFNYHVEDGIRANGPGAKVNIADNTVTGLGPVNDVAQYGIQVGNGADAQVMRNLVSRHSYSGPESVAGGILVVGSPLGAYTVGTQIVGNVLLDNDIGVWLANLPAPLTQTNIKVINNVIISTGLYNGLTRNPPWIGYQAGVLDSGNNDKIISNTILGLGYDPAANPGAFTVAIEADPPLSIRPKVHANE